MPRSLVLFRLSNPGLALFCACFRYPVLSKLCPYTSRYNMGSYIAYNYLDSRLLRDPLFSLALNY